ncbi:MAG: universal stress protein [Chloroflexota bacterium]
MKILVPLDGSVFSEAILGPVVQVAEAVDAEVHLLTVVEDPEKRNTWLEAFARAGEGTEDIGIATPFPAQVSQPSESGVDTESKGQALERAIHTAEEYLAQIAGRFSPGRAKTKVITGEDTVGIILDFSLEQRVDLIAMSTHGRSGLGRWVFGSTADKLLHSDSLSLLLIRPKDAGEAPKPIDTLIVPLDGSELAESALPYVENLAKQMALKISLMRIVSTPTLAYTGTEAYVYDPKIFSGLENDAVNYLRQKQTELEHKGFKVEHTVKGGYPADYIIDFAEAHEGSLIVMSTHGRSGIGRWLMGSVADRVLRASYSPILLIRPQAEKA